MRGCHALRLPPLNDTIRFATIAGSHSNQVLRMWHYGLPHSSPKLTTNGRLSMELLERNDGAYFQAVKDGCSWEVVSGLVAREFPGFAALAQSAANAAQQVARPETELQLAIKMAGLFNAWQGSDVIPFDKVGPQMYKTKPPAAETIPPIYQFLLKCGGGKSSHLMAQTEQWIRSNGASGRSLGESMWQQLATELRDKNQEQLVLWRHAMLKALFSLSPKPFTSGDVKRSLVNPDMFKKAMEFEHVHQQVKKIGVQVAPQQQVSQHLGIFEVESVMVILGKKLKDVPPPFEQWDDIRFAAHKCVTSWCTLAGVPVQSPWTAFVESRQSSASTAVSDKAERGRTAR